MSHGKHAKAGDLVFNCKQTASGGFWERRKDARERFLCSILKARKSDLIVGEFIY